MPEAHATDGSARGGAAGEGVVARAKALLDRWKQTRVARALARYSIARGGLLAGGISYSALFSISAALTITWTIFMTVLGGNAELRGTVIDGINQALPGIIDDGSGTGIVTPDQLVLDTAITPTSVVAAAVLLWTALSVMTALKKSIRAMFGIVAPPEQIVVAKLRDLLGFVALALGVLLTAALGLLAGALAETVLGAIGVEGAVTGWLLRGLSFLVALAVDWAVFVMLFRVTAGVRPERRDLVLGALLGAVATGVLRQLGTALVRSVDDPLLASFAAIATLLLWVNLVARVALVVAAVTANPPAPERAGSPEEMHLDHRPNYVTVSDPETLDWEHQPVTGTIVPDPTLAPDYEPDPEPRRGGLVGWWQRRRIARLEEKLAGARADYAAGAREAALRGGETSRS